MHDVELLAVPVARRLERAPAAVLEFGPGLHLGSAHLIQGSAGQRDDVDVVPIEADRRLGRGVAAPGLGL